MIRTVKPEATNIRTNAGKVIAPSPVIVTGDGYNPSVQRLRTNAGKVIATTPSVVTETVYQPPFQVIRKNAGKRIEVKSDPFAPFVTLHLKGDGSNGSTTFTDSSSFNHSVTRSGNTVISTAQSKYGGSSIYFDGDNDWLQIAYNPHTYTQNITIECWVYPTILGSQSVFDLTRLQLNGLRTIGVGTGALVQQVVAGGTSIAPSFTLNAWSHFAVAVFRNQYMVFVNGIQIGSTVTISPLLTSEGNVYIGTANTGDFDFAGYIDSFRITEACRYVANFDPEVDTYLGY